ncbi:2-amino-4-hydroxy-6-hydroxymethyldihydropteridine diphosphokinase [Polaribacter tangerinus]|uniref:2-amino-4-hydroxy-6- hydroxymethyldihydropteridine diphosphokinase n=1 Tax=Polaribacter tangerinus TaxID=1920034 RepID=UPI000B4C0325|nr:2-amino-4-hydroxy-6-hydroxymethyldihydropteridine diphosphokinase [Polaribacter tangerinus]
MKIQNITYLSIGTNEGNKVKNLQNTIQLIEQQIGNVLKISAIYKTPSWGFNGNDFYNICIKVGTSKTVENLLKIILNIEQQIGRERTNSSEYQNRKIDIDILLFNNDIILSEKLIVPHPKMLDRLFVLKPLEEIAKNVIHPANNKTIRECLAATTDSSKITLIKDTLKTTIPFTEKYNYIAIEGNIGAGKTSLAKLLSEEYNAKKVFERFADNPFLPKFYKNKERYAFPLEMSFLADRYQQLSDDLAQFDLFKSFIISDYYIFKSLIFAQINLTKEEYHLYRKMFDIMYKEITKPDLYIYLHQNTDRLLENIKKRGRSYEQNINADYLIKINKGYETFIKTQENLNFLIIDVSDKDFVKNKLDYIYIKDKLNNY